MKLTNDIILEFNSGYFEVQHKKVAEESGNEYLSSTKTFATLSHLEKYLAPYVIAQGDLIKACEESRIEAGIKSAKAANEMKNKRKEQLK